MNTLKFCAVIITMLINLNANAQLKVLATGRVDILNQHLISANRNGDVLDVTNSASNVSYGMDLIWANYTGSQVNNPGLLKLATAYTAKFVVKTNGYVGICTSSPSFNLDVTGTGRFTGNLTLVSDERLKKDVLPLKNSKSSLLQLKGVTYTLKTTPELFAYDMKGRKEIFKDSIKMKLNEPDPDFYKIKHNGFNAHDVEKLFPELVFKDSLGLLSIDYIGLIPILVEALKEQDNQLIDQKNKIENLESRVLSLESILNVSSKKSATDLTQLDLNTPSLLQNTPNPFNQETEIGFYLPESSSTAMINIYNMSGNPVKSFSITKTGQASILINESELKPGMYLYTLIVNGIEVDTKRMIMTE